MIRIFAVFGALLFLSPALIGCSRAASQGGGASSTSASDEAVDGASAKNDEPVEIKVGAAFLQGDQLTVKIYVTPRTPLLASDVAVTLIGLSEGEVLGEKTELMSRIVSEPVLKADETTLIQLALPNDKLSEYQVKCSWGEEAHVVARRAGIEVSPVMPDVAVAQATKEKPAAPEQVASARKVEERATKEIAPPSEGEEVETLTEVLPESLPPDIRGDIETPPEKIETKKPEPEKPAPRSGSLRLVIHATEREELACDVRPCDMNYAFRAELVNDSAVPVTGIRLALGVRWVNDGDPVGEPAAVGTPAREDEQVIDLAQLKLESGGNKNLRLGLDRALPAVPGGRFVPQLRLLDYHPAAG